MRAGASGSYPIHIGPGILERMAGDLGHLAAGGSRRTPVRVVVISDGRVAALYGGRVLELLRRHGVKAALLSFPRGERHKTRETKAVLEDGLARIGFGSDGIIVALGGGVTGDLAGLVAATWHRGVCFVQAPTSLIAMLDAAIGGKVAVDHPLAKNLIGAWHHPLAVYADTDVLETLPRREFLAGLAEAGKCGVIADAGLFRLIERSRDPLRRRDRAILARVVRRAAAVKAGLVSLDERDHGARRLLNYGHTIGHAVEAAGGWSLRHGEAVAIGAALEARLSVDLGLLDEDDRGRIERLLTGLGLPITPPAGLKVERILAAMRLDKKVRGVDLFFALPRTIGSHAGAGRFVVPAPVAAVRRVLVRSLRSGSRQAGRGTST